MSKMFMPILTTIAVLCVFLLQFGFIFLLVALLPSIMAFFVDQTESKSVFKTVLIGNFAATLPFLMPMLSAGLQFKYFDVSSIMTDPSVWLIVYGGAAAGWCLVYLCRFIAHFLLIIIYEYRIIALERFQKKLIDEWGQQLKQVVPLKK